MKKEAFIITLTVVLLLSNLCTASVEAIKRYGYKPGNSYKWVFEMRSIADIEEDTDGYSIKVDYTTVTSGMQYSGSVSTGQSIIYEGTMEGDQFLQPSGGFPTGWFITTNVFTTADWDDLSKEWEDYWDNIDNQKDYKVTQSSAAGGRFNAEMEIDSESGWDWDGDGDYDHYIGTASIAVEYDREGVLASSSMNFVAEFDSRNRSIYEYTVRRDGGGLDLMELLPVAIIGVVALVIGFAIGLIVKGYKSASPPASTISQET